MSVADAFVEQLLVDVLRRVEQGMGDADVTRYLDYRRRGLPPGSEELAVINDVKRVFCSDDSLLRERVVEIRTREEQKEWERLRRAREMGERLMIVPGVDDDVVKLWRDELRYKNSLIPPGARGGGGGGRRSKKETKRSLQSRYCWDYR